MSYKDLQQLLSEKRLQYLIQKRVLLETEKKWFFDNIRQLEIENQYSMQLEMPVLSKSYFAT